MSKPKCCRKPTMGLEYTRPFSFNSGDNSSKALSLGLDIDYLAFLVFTPIILFSMTLPISIGGWGIRETTALFISFLLGLSANVSISVAIIYGLLSLICSLPGLVLFLSTKNR